MITITKRPFTYEKDFIRLFEFLSENYDCGTYHNWDTGRLMHIRYGVYNRFHSKDITAWEEHAMLWENEDGQIVACAHCEEPGDYFMQVAKEYKSLEEDMMEWIQSEWANILPKENSKSRFILTASSNDEARKRLFEKHNGKLIDGVDKKRIAYLDHLRELPSINESYIIAKMSPNDLSICQKVARCYNYIWPYSRYLPNKTALADLLRAPACDNELTWAIVDDTNNTIAYTLGYKDSLDRIVHLYPVAIKKEFLDTPVLEYLLTSALNDCYLAGFSAVTIGSSYSSKEEAIFEQLGFVTEDEELFYEFTDSSLL